MLKLERQNQVNGKMVHSDVKTIFIDKFAATFSGNKICTG